MSICCCIIPVYNAEAYLEACLCSVLNQSHSELDIILINDGSTDGSGDIIRRYAEADTRIRVLTQSNQGQSAARNAGLALACESRAPYIVFIDSDDTISPDYVERLIHTLETQAADVAVCGYEREGRAICADPEESVVCFDHADMGRELFENRSIGLHPWGKIIRAHKLQTLRFMNGRIYEDDLFCVQLFSMCDRVAVLRAPLYHYTVNASGTTYGRYSQKRIDILPISLGKLQIAETHWPAYLPRAMYIAACSFIDLHIEYARRHLDRDAEFTEKLLSDREELYRFFDEHRHLQSRLINKKLDYYYTHMGKIMLRDRVRFARYRVVGAMRKTAKKILR